MASRTKKSRPPVVALLACYAAIASSGAALGRNPLPFQPGAEAIGVAGLGVITERSPVAVMHNPANLKARGAVESYGEMLTFALQHTYAHPNYDPYTLTLFAPFPVVGGAAKIGQRVTLGVAALTTGIGTETKVDGMPMEVTAGNYARTYATAKNTGYHLGLGASWAVHPRLTLGLALTQIWESMEITADLEDADEPGERVEATSGQWSGSYAQVGVGARLALPGWTFAASIKPPVVVKYSGTSLSPDTSGTLVENDIAPSDYQPLTVGLGVLGRFGPWGPHAEFQRRNFAAGSEQTYEDISALEPRATALRDTNAFGAGTTYRLSRSSDVGGGVSYQQGRLAAGSFAGQDGPDRLGYAGMRFGEFDGMDRLSAAVNLRGRFGKRMRYGLGGQLTSGSASIPEGARNAGEYTLLVAILSSSIHYRF